MTTPPDDNEKPKLVRMPVDPVLVGVLHDLYDKAAILFFREYNAQQQKEGKEIICQELAQQCAAIAALDYSWSMTFHVSRNNKSEALECMSRNLNTISAEPEPDEPKEEE